MSSTIKKLKINQLALLVALCAQAAWAAPVTINLAAQPLDQALTEFARSASVQLLFDASQFKNQQAPALTGQYEVEQALDELLKNSNFEVVKSGAAYVIRPAAGSKNSIKLQAVTIVGEGNQVDSDSVGRSTLSRNDIDRLQSNNIPALLQTLPGISMTGSDKPGGQRINIWGLGDAEDVPFTLDGAVKSGFERYQQGTIFIEPELIKSIEVEKGPHSVFSGNGGFGGTVHMETRDAADMLEPDATLGLFVKHGYQSNNHEQSHSFAVYGRTNNNMFDGLIYTNYRESGDLKLAGHIDLGEGYKYPKRYPYTAQKQASGLLKGNFRPNEEHTFSLTYSRTVNQLKSPFSAITFLVPGKWSIDNAGGLKPAMRRLLSNREIFDTTWSGKYKYQPLDNPWVDLQVSYSLSQTEQVDKRGENASYNSSTGGKYIRTKYQDDVFELRNISRFDTFELAHELTTGIQLHKHQRKVLMFLPTYQKNPKYNYGWYQPPFMPEGDQLVRSAYVQDAITLGSVTITPSMRFDHVRNQGTRNLAEQYNNPAMGHDYSSKNYSGWSPRLSIFWRATDRLGLFADYASTWRAPVIDEQYEVQSSSTWGASSLQLDPERIVSVRGGAVLNLPNLFTYDDSLQIRTTLFRNKIKDEIFKSRGIGCENQAINGGTVGTACKGDLPLSNYRNLNESVIRGVEIESFYDSDRIFASLSYTWMEGKNKGAYSNPWGPKVWARDIPPVKWVAMLGVKVPEADMKLGWQGEFMRKSDRLPSDLYNQTAEFYWNHYGSDSYVVHRLFAQWAPETGPLRNVNVNFAVDNLFNKFYRPALSGDSAYAQGRNAKLSISYRL